MTMKCITYAAGILLVTAYISSAQQIKKQKISNVSIISARKVKLQVDTATIKSHPVSKKTPVSNNRLVKNPAAYKHLAPTSNKNISAVSNAQKAH